MIEVGTAEAEADIGRNLVENSIERGLVLTARPQQDAAAFGWKTVAINHHQIDVRTAFGNPVLEHEQRFVEHGTEGTLEKLFVR